jgi:hypothetical protein
MGGFSEARNIERNAAHYHHESSGAHCPLLTNVSPVHVLRLFPGSRIAAVATGIGLKSLSSIETRLKLASRTSGEEQGKCLQ